MRDALLLERGGRIFHEVQATPATCRGQSALIAVGRGVTGREPTAANLRESEA